MREKEQQLQSLWQESTWVLQKQETKSVLLEFRVWDKGRTGSQVMRLKG